jgi:hypothetical protein
MPNISAWLGGEGQPTVIAEVISRKSVSTGTVTRGTTTVTAKTIRLETLSGQGQMQGPNGMQYSLDAYALGEVGTDLRVGDRFTINGQKFTVIMLMPGHTDCEQYYLTLRA